MIRKFEFKKLQLEVQTSINEAFDYAKKHEKNENDYILFLSRSCYDEKLDKSRFSPWKIDDSLNELFDRHRVDFLIQYLNELYSFKTENTADSRFSLTLELMIYTHIWESFHNLYNLKRLADLCRSKSYCWSVNVGSKSRAKFVAREIKEPFQSQNLKIGDLIDR